MKSPICVSNICVINRKQTASFSIAGLMLAIAPLWLMLAAANTSACAQSTPPSWVQGFGSEGNGANIANAIKAAPDHNLYVAGQFSGTATFGGTTITATGPFDIFLAKYTSTGSLLWIAQTSKTDTNYNPARNGVDLDANGNVYVTGSFAGNATFYSANPADKKITLISGSGEAIFLAKYTPSGALLWVQTGISNCFPDTACTSYGVAVNPAAGTVYIPMATQGGDTTFSSADGTSHDIPADYYPHMTLAKYATNGNFLWAETNMSYDVDTGGTGVAVDSKDNAYIVGWFSGETVFYSADAPAITVNTFSPVADQYGDYVGSDTFLAKYDKNGNAQWVNHFCGYTSYPGAVAVGPSGEVILAGTTEDMNYLFPVYLTPVTSSTSVSSQPPGAGINLGSGTITNPGNTDEVIATYNPAGVLIRAQRRGGTASESATGVAYDSRDNLYVTGLVEGNAQPKLFVDEYSGKNLLWEATASAEKWEQPVNTPALTVDAAGSVFVTGGYNGTASFGDIELSGTGTSEVFVAGLNTAFANQSADLLLRLTASPTPVHQGDLLTFTFPVWNRGPNVAYLEELKTQVPPGTAFDYIRISGTEGLGTCTTPLYGGTGPVTCYENSAMAPNTTWTPRLTVKVTAPAGSAITETGTVTEVTPDPNAADATATVSMTVQ
jgi:Domain of unknown function DUF11